MNKNLIDMIGIIGIFLIVVFLFKINDNLVSKNQIGRYVNFTSNYILDTTNGNVYIPDSANQGDNTRFIWKKYFSFRKQNTEK
jgi:hypothetical protein